MSLNHEALKQRRERRGGAGWKPREGANKIRILPPRSVYLPSAANPNGEWNKMDDLSIPYKMHFFKVEGRQTEVTRCLEELKQPCPACKAWRDYRKSADPAFAAMAKSIAPSDQYLFNILDLNNPQKGIQRWTANYTCWDKIMEVAASPQWGNVVNPADGVNFDVTMTPGSRSRTGWNQYSVMPEPIRTTVTHMLDSIPNWQAELDSLDDQITPAKEPEEILGLLAEIGFPGYRTAAAAAPATASPFPQAPVGFAPPPPAYTPPPAAVPAAAPVPAITYPAIAAPAAVPVPAAAPVPVSVPAAAPVPVAVPAAAPVAVPVPQAPPVEQRVNVASVFSPAAPAAAAQSGGVHYDPGPDYVPKVVDFERPPGAPRCYGDYDPRRFRCQPCPVLAECQMKMLDTP